MAIKRARVTAYKQRHPWTRLQEECAGVSMDARRAKTRPDGRNTVNDSRPRRGTLNASIANSSCHSGTGLRLTNITVKPRIFSEALEISGSSDPAALSARASLMETRMRPSALG